MARPPKTYDFHKNGRVVARGTIKQLSKQLIIPEFRLKNWNKEKVRESYRNGIARQALIEVRPDAPRVYALYRGEDIEALGTLDEIAEYTGLKRDTLLRYRYPVSRRQPWHTRLVEIGDDYDADE